MFHSRIPQSNRTRSRHKINVFNVFDWWTVKLFVEAVRSLKSSCEEIVKYIFMTLLIGSKQNVAMPKVELPFALVQN